MLFQLFEVNKVGYFFADELLIFVEWNFNVLKDDMEQVASDLSDVFLTDVNTLMALYFLVDHFDLVHSPLVVFVTLLKGVDEGDD